MKILFLDVDGVLNHRAIYQPGNSAPLCPHAIERLHQVVAATGCSVVLSSTWRKEPRLVERLRGEGVLQAAHPDYRTKDRAPSRMRGSPFLAGGLRGKEIAEWLSRHPEVARFAIVDDDADFLHGQMAYFVQTNFDTGLQNDHVERLVAILNA